MVCIEKKHSIYWIQFSLPGDLGIYLFWKRGDYCIFLCSAFFAKKNKNKTTVYFFRLVKWKLFLIHLSKACCENQHSKLWPFLTSFTSIKYIKNASWFNQHPFSKIPYQSKHKTFWNHFVMYLYQIHCIYFQRYTKILLWLFLQVIHWSSGFTN